MRIREDLVRLERRAEEPEEELVDGMTRSPFLPVATTVREASMVAGWSLPGSHAPGSRDVARLRTMGSR